MTRGTPHGHTLRDMTLRELRMHLLEDHGVTFHQVPPYPPLTGGWRFDELNVLHLKCHGEPGYGPTPSLVERPMNAEVPF